MSDIHQTKKLVLRHVSMEHEACKVCGLHMQHLGRLTTNPGCTSTHTVQGADVMKSTKSTPAHLLWLIVVAPGNLNNNTSDMKVESPFLPHLVHKRPFTTIIYTISHRLTDHCVLDRTTDLRKSTTQS